MFANPSLTTRIAVGKLAGFVVGIVGFFWLPYFDPGASTMMRWGFLFWYTTVGAIIGVFGVYTWNPVLKMAMPSWFMGPWIGAWMNFVLVLFMYDRFLQMMQTVMGADGAITSPFWFVLEGAIVGLIIGYLATRFGGEGPETIQDMPS